MVVSRFLRQAVNVDEGHGQDSILQRGNKTWFFKSARPQDPFSLPTDDVKLEQHDRIVRQGKELGFPGSLLLLLLLWIAFARSAPIDPWILECVHLFLIITVK
jgi:hypothetical protein